MRKLFSAMLAATMVAGASITAFAYADSDSNWDTNYFGDNDYAVIGAYDEDGVKLDGKNNKARVDSGDKIYYPILLSGDEIDKDILTEHGQGEKMFFADKASEVKDLKASVKDEVGGKYIDSASIVKKDISIDKKGEADRKETFTVNLSDVTAKLADTTSLKNDVTEAETKLDEAKKANTDSLKTAVTDAQTKLDEANKALKDNKDTGKVAELTTAVTDAQTKLDEANKAVTDAEKAVTDAQTKLDEANKALAAGAKVEAVKVTIDGTDVNVKPAKADDNASFLAALKDTTIGGYKVVDVTNSKAVKFEATSVGKKDDAKKVVVADAQAGAGEKTVSNIHAGSGSSKSIGKVYCVEVKMSDYFKNEETEVEFNIKLKNKGKTEYDTDDDNKLFNGTFDLGRDSETLDVRNKKAVDGIEVKKFKNGDLEIKIGKDTKSVQLDEAINSKGDKEDIDTIYIENDDSIDSAFTFDVKASNQDDLYLELNQDAIKDLAVSNQKADLTFFNFPGTPEFDFAGTATFAVEDEDEDNYFYEVVDGELVETKAKYNDDDGVFELRTNKLGSYVISDKELDTSAKEEKKDDDTENKEQEAAGGDLSADSTQNNGGKGNANTGAADLIGVASALAVVSVAAAGAVALKK